MSDALNAAVEQLSSKLPEDFDTSVRFDIEDEGSILLDQNGVSVSEGDAEVVISSDLDTFKEMFDGDLDPTSAFMSGKIKIDGDMSAAMKLAQIFT